MEITSYQIVYTSKYIFKNSFLVIVIYYIFILHFLQGRLPSEEAEWG